MCRALAYLGTPAFIDEFLYKPDSSLIRQTYAPQMLGLLNLAGFGLLAWSRYSYNPEEPFRYKSEQIPIFDANLKGLANKIKANCILAHVRGVSYDHLQHVSRQNIHPFQFSGFKLSMAHNGFLINFPEVKRALMAYVKPDFEKLIEGSTDSEHLYAVLMSQLKDPYHYSTLSEIGQAVEKTLDIIDTVYKKMGISTCSIVNLFLSDGNKLVAVRYCFDFGNYGESVEEWDLSYLSLWYTFGQDYGLHDGEWKMVQGAANSDSIIVASEPLTQDSSTWMELPEYSMLMTSAENNLRDLVIKEL